MSSSSRKFPTHTTLVAWMLSSYSGLRLFADIYGINGIVLWIFGNRSVWRSEVQLLRHRDDKEAMDFRKSAQDESSIVAVAVRTFDQRPLHN